MTAKSIFLSIACVISLFCSCKSIQIEKPKESYLPSNLSPVISELPLQVELDVKKLEIAINKKMNGLIYDGTKISDKDLSVKVWKSQNFTFTINNNVIEYRVPLKVWSRFAWRMEKFGLAVGDEYEANGSIALMYKTTIQIDKNWKLVSKTVSSGYQWTETPKLNVVGINVPVTPIANLVLSRCDQLISDQIDKSLADAVDLKKYMSLAWTEVQKPRQVSSENDLWIRINPKDLYLSPLTTVGNKLNMAVAFYAQIESFMGTQPLANASLALPPLKYINRPARQFNLNIGTDVTFDKFSEMAKKELLNKKFTDGKKSITITDLSIFGSEGKAVFVADVIGSIKGRIYFTGIMAYNPTKIAVEITDPEFSLKTKNTLVKSANWLLHGMILKKMMPYLSYPVKNDLDKLKTDANNMLSNYPVYDGITLQGQLNNIQVTNLSLIPGALRIQANIKGNVALKVDDLKL